MSQLLNWIIKNKENDKTAFIYRENDQNTYQNITYSQTYEYIISLSNYLKKYKNKTIAIIGNNKIEYVISLLSIICNIGNAFVVDKELNKNELNKLFKNIEPDLIIVDDEIKIEFEDIETLKFSEINKIMKSNYKFNIKYNFSGNLILHTSGTTGVPKIVSLTEEMYLYIIKDLNKNWKVAKEHSCLFIIPLYHIYALTSLFHGIYAGVTNILEWEYSKLEIVLKETNPSIFLGVPLIFNKIKEKSYKKGGTKLKIGINISNLLLFFNIDIRKKLFKEIHDYFGNNYYFSVSGGSLANPETNKFFNDIGLPVYNGYGMTETSGPITICYEKNNDYNSVGKILNNDIKIIDRDEKGVGEICIGGKNVINQYVNDKNEEYFINNYFKTGDLGYVKNGFLYITGRKKDILIGENGKNISSKELSEKILKNEKIYDCIMKMENNEIIAIIDTDLDELQIKRIIEKVNNELPNYKKISNYKIIKKGIKDENN